MDLKLASSDPASRYNFCATCFELIALDDVADLIFAEVAELDAALEADADFLHVVLETAQGREPAIVNRLAPAQDPRPGGAADPPISDQAAGDDPSAQLERPVSLRRGR